VQPVFRLCDAAKPGDLLEVRVVTECGAVGSNGEVTEREGEDLDNSVRSEIDGGRSWEVCSVKRTGQTKRRKNKPLTKERGAKKNLESGCGESSTRKWYDEDNNKSRGSRRIDEFFFLRQGQFIQVIQKCPTGTGR
jgi:hypothetical protein